MNTGITLIENTKKPVSIDAGDKKDKVTDATSSSLKRRKVLKTRIDERGREVTEVVWEGEEVPEIKKNEKTSSTTASDNRPRPASKKSPALGSNAPSNPVSKAGGKKAGKGGGVKDAKQGNILSFFKKVASSPQPSPAKSTREVLHLQEEQLSRWRYLLWPPHII